MDQTPVPQKLTRAKAHVFFERLAARMPAPQSELDYVDPYTLLVAVVLSAQATDAGVNKATDKLFPVADTPQKMVKLGEKKLGDTIKTIGLWRNKAKNVIALSQKLIDEHGGEIPRAREALEALPGVGRKTANVVCNVAFGQPTIAVDTHIFRVSNRTGLAPGKNPLDVERGLEKIVPAEFRMGAHHWLILHGRYVCKARKPDCPNCVVADLCLYKDKTQADEKPAVKKKAAAKKKNAKKPTRKMAGRPKLRTAKRPARKIKTVVKTRRRSS
ncbi:MAG: endonuclease III [Parvularculaceae bacterium]